MSRRRVLGFSIILTTLAILSPWRLTAEPAKLANIRQISDLVIPSPANVSLDNGRIAFVGQTATPLGPTDVYFYDGTNVSMLTNNPEREDGIGLSNGRIVWSATIPGTIPQRFAVFLEDGGVRQQVSGLDAYGAAIDGNVISWVEPTGIYVLDLSTMSGARQIFSGGPIFRAPSLHQNQIAWVFQGMLYLYDLASDTLTPISTDVDLNSQPSLHSGQIAWNRGPAIFLWDGTDTVEIPTGDGTFPSELSLFAGRLAWSALDPVDFSRELYYYDGEATSRLTDFTSSTFVKMPSLDGSQLAFAQSGDDQGLFLADIVNLADQVGDLAEEIQKLVDAGILNNGQANALLSKLASASASFDKGNLVAAQNTIRAFINQVEGFVSAGVLTAAEGQVLIDAANVILALFTE